MAFTSILLPGEQLIDDGNFHLHVEEHNDICKASNNQERNRGRVPRDYGKMPRGALAPYASTSGIPDVPEHLWTDMIQQMETGKTRLSDLLLLKKIKSKDQNGTNYCWCNAVITALETLRCRMNLPFVQLSPASVAAQIKRYSNQGGWGGEALEFIIKYGVCPTSLWPDNYWSSNKYLNDTSVKAAAEHKVDAWFELDSRSFSQLMSCVLNRIPVPIGLNWWSHEICAMDGVVLGPNQYGIRIRNSWGDGYGSQGFSVLTRSKATPDDAVAPYGTLATAV